MKKALTITDLAPRAGSKFLRTRIGRGIGSGIGKTSGSGHKGQRARGRGHSIKGPAFEGGQMPLVRRLPKVGFKSPFRVEYTAVNLSILNRFDNGSTVDTAVLRQAGITKSKMPIKILGKGKLEKKLVVKAHAYSESARAAIIAAGGTADVVE